MSAMIKISGLAQCGIFSWIIVHFSNSSKTQNQKNIWKQFFAHCHCRKNVMQKGVQRSCLHLGVKPLKTEVLVAKILNTTHLRVPFQKLSTNIASWHVWQGPNTKNICLHVAKIFVWYLNWQQLTGCRSGSHFQNGFLNKTRQLCSHSHCQYCHRTFISFSCQPNQPTNTTQGSVCAKYF